MYTYICFNLGIRVGANEMELFLTIVKAYKFIHHQMAELLLTEIIFENASKFKTVIICCVLLRVHLCRAIEH